MKCTADSDWTAKIATTETAAEIGAVLDGMRAANVAAQQRRDGLKVKLDGATITGKERSELKRQFLEVTDEINALEGAIAEALPRRKKLVDEEALRHRYAVVQKSQDLADLYVDRLKQWMASTDKAAADGAEVERVVREININNAELDSFGDSGASPINIGALRAATLAGLTEQKH